MIYVMQMQSVIDSRIGEADPLLTFCALFSLHWLVRGPHVSAEVIAMSFRPHPALASAPFAIARVSLSRSDRVRLPCHCVDERNCMHGRLYQKSIRVDSLTLINLPRMIAWAWLSRQAVLTRDVKHARHIVASNRAIVIKRCTEWARSTNRGGHVERFARTRAVSVVRLMIHAPRHPAVVFSRVRDEVVGSVFIASH